MLAPPSYRHGHDGINSISRPPAGVRRRRAAIALLALTGVTLISLPVAIDGVWRALMKAPLHDAATDWGPPSPPSGPAHFELNVPGIRSPKLAHRWDDRLSAGMTVVGVVIRGHARAYRLDALKFPSIIPNGPSALNVVRRHVVNDVIDSTAVTVTHCDVSGCTRVFVAPDRQEPLPVAVGGQMHNKMYVMWDGQRYAQDDPSIPLQDGEFQITTWESWCAEHPDTTVYVGES